MLLFKQILDGIAAGDDVHDETVAQLLAVDGGLGDYLNSAGLLVETRPFWSTEAMLPSMVYHSILGCASTPVTVAVSWSFLPTKTERLSEVTSSFGSAAGAWADQGFPGSRSQQIRRRRSRQAERYHHQ